MQHFVTWQWLSGFDSRYLHRTPNRSGFNVYAPVMYGVGSSALHVIKDFTCNMALAKRNGYRVWLTFQQFGTSPNLESSVIDEILSKAIKHRVAGINIDFEGMGQANRDRFTGFIRNLYRYTRKLGLVLSVDVVRPAVSLYSLCYDRRALAEACDYLVLMAYDQHWATSPQEGSVAELPWTEDSVKSLVQNQNVPPHKLILAVPFYSRNWKIKTEGNRRLVSSTAVGLQAGLEIMANYNSQNKTSSFGGNRMFNVEISYDSKAEQVLVTYRDGEGHLNRIWVEDFQSLAKRYRLAQKYGLAGMAAWSLEWLDKDQKAWVEMRRSND